MAVIQIIYKIAGLANPIYKIAVSTVLMYSLYHRHKQFKAENERKPKAASEQDP